MPENNENVEIDLSSINIQDLQKLLESFKQGLSLTDIDSDTITGLDGDKESFSDSEKKILEKLKEESDKIDLIETIILQIQGHIGQKTKSNEKGKANYENANTYTYEDSFTELEILNNEYSNYKESETKQIKASGKKRKVNNSGEKQIEKVIKLENKNDVEQTQCILINNILGKGRSYNYSYIRGFNNIEGHKIISIAKFEQSIKNSQRTIGSSDFDNTLLSNYLLKAKKESGLNEDFLINKLSTQNIKNLKIELEDPSSQLSIKLKEKGIFEETKNSLNIQEIKNNGESINIHKELLEKSDEFFLENQHLIININNKDKLLSVLKLAKEKSLNEIYIDEINKSVINSNPSIILNENFHVYIDPLTVFMIPDSLIIENLDDVINKYSHIRSDIYKKAVSIGISNEKINESINKFNNSSPSTDEKYSFYDNQQIKEMEFVKILLGDGEIKTLETFNKLYSKIMESEDTLDFPKGLESEYKLITSYMIKNHSIMGEEMKELAKRNHYGYNNILISPLNKSIEFFEYFINKDDFRGVIGLDRGVLSNPEIIKIIFEKGDKDDIRMYLERADIGSLNNLIKVLSFNQENDENFKEYISELMLSDRIRANMYSVLQSDNKSINKKYIGKYYILEEALVLNFGDIIAKANQAGDNLSTIASSINDKDLDKKESASTLIHKSLIKFIKENNIECGDEELLKNIVENFISNRSDLNAKAYKELKSIIGNKKDFEKTITRLHKLKKEDFEKKKDDLIEKQAPEVKEVIENYLKQNSIGSINELTDEDIEKIIENIESEEKKEEIKKYIEEIQDLDLKISEQKRIIDNTDLYIKYMDNPDKKGSFDEFLEIEKQIQEGKINQEQLNNTNNNYYFTNEESYSDTGNGFSILGKDGTAIEGLIISEKEKNLTIGNPEATENLINFYLFFKELNLESVWEYREQLFISMGNRDINFVDDDSLSKSELIQFGNSLLIGINNLSEKNEKLKDKPKLSIQSTIGGIKNELRKFSGAGSMLSDNKTYNIEGEDAFESTLRNFGIIGGTYFKTYELRKNIK